MKKVFAVIITLFLSLCFISPAWAFCGFYVAKADTNLYNKSSQVVIAKDGERTVLTMANDYQGNIKDFAIVVPVPVVLQEDQVHIGDPTILERLDAFSAPRLVEYFDRNPCEPMYRADDGVLSNAPAPTMMKEERQSANALGVTIEAKFTVGEYDILILSAKESDGLETWLRQNGYRIPRGGNDLLRPYIRQQMKFFVAKVNLEEFNKTGYSSLRPLMMAYESPKFMLPIRLGMMNAQNEQDLIAYLLSPKGQIQVSNYRTVKVTSDVNIPEFVQKEFGDFYTSMFKKDYERENKNVAFLEYAWDMSSCDPCSAEPLTNEELRKAGVFWLNENPNPNFYEPNRVFITRLHVRYSRDKFPEDLNFQETGNQEFFQGRYILNHPYRGEMNCSESNNYLRSTRTRQDQEAQTLANITGWDITNIREKIDFVKPKPTSWWENLWKWLVK